MTDHVNRELLLARCDFLVESQLWPIEQDLDYQGWLGNFLDCEQKYAECLLNGFMFFSQAITRQLFLVGFNRLFFSVQKSDPSGKPQDAWNAFKDSLLVTHVTGEDPSPSDSGYAFARLARQFLGLKESQIVTNEYAVEKLWFDGPVPLLFVDDFVGSGNQFCDTWERFHTIAPTVSVSFQRAMQKHTFPAYYCPVISTIPGKQKISKRAPEVTLSPAHLIDETYSVFSNSTPIWPEHLRSNAEAFLRSASTRAGITSNWRGFHNLGLLIAFQDGGPPDATLPLIYHESSHWKPLVRRT